MHIAMEEALGGATDGLNKLRRWRDDDSIDLTWASVRRGWSGGNGVDTDEIVLENGFV